MLLLFASVRLHTVWVLVTQSTRISVHFFRVNFGFGQTKLIFLTNPLLEVDTLRPGLTKLIFFTNPLLEVDTLCPRPSNISFFTKPLLEVDTLCTRLSKLKSQPPEPTGPPFLCFQFVLQVDMFRPWSAQAHFLY